MLILPVTRNVQASSTLIVSAFRVQNLLYYTETVDTPSEVPLLGVYRNIRRLHCIVLLQPTTDNVAE